MLMYIHFFTKQVMFLMESKTKVITLHCFSGGLGSLN